MANAKLTEIGNVVENGKVKEIASLVQAALDEGVQPLSILNEAMMGAMGRVGDKFQSGEIFVPEMLIAAKTMKKGVEVLKPLLKGTETTTLGTCIIGTVYGDLHDIGKNLVTLMIESAGFEVIDLGVDVPIAKFLDTLKEKPDTKIVALSALLTTTLPALKETAQAIKASGYKGRLIVGGAPVTQAFADEIGADGYSADAAGAAKLAKSLVTA